MLKVSTEKPDASMVGGMQASDTLDAYFAGCQERVPGFVRRHFGTLGALRLHREALGLDLLRAPLNVLLVGPAFFARLIAMLLGWIGLKRLARWLASRRFFVETGLSQKIATLVADELLELDKVAGQDPPPAWVARVEDLISEYVAARHAVAELAAGIIALTLGLLLLHAMTPSALTLGPILAREYAQGQAVGGFWAGSWLGGYYYALWPAEASWPETIGMTVLVLILFAIGSTFMGVLTDPLQNLLGLHAQRLHRFIATLRRLAGGEAEARLGLPDPYIARLADVVDWVTLGLRTLR